VEDLSGGELQRFAIGVVVVQDAQIYVSLCVCVCVCVWRHFFFFFFFTRRFRCWRHASILIRVVVVQDAQIYLRLCLCGVKAPGVGVCGVIFFFIYFLHCALSSGVKLLF
jgi:hypothetical protein